MNPCHSPASETMCRDDQGAVLIRPLFAAQKAILVPVTDQTTVGDLKQHLQTNMGMPTNVQSMVVPPSTTSAAKYAGKTMKDTELVRLIFPHLFLAQATDSVPELTLMADPSKTRGGGTSGSCHLVHQIPEALNVHILCYRCGVKDFPQVVCWLFCCA